MLKISSEFRPKSDPLNEHHSYEKLNDLEEVIVKTTIDKSDKGQIVINISNPNNETAFFIRLKITDGHGDLVLPSYFTDNYFTLLHGDKKQVDLDLSGSLSPVNLDELKLVVEDWNILPEEVKF